MRSDVLFDGVLHVTMLWGLLLSFFTFYASRQEVSAFKAEFGKVVHDALGGASVRRMLAGTRASTASLQASLQSALRQPDPVVAANNRGVLRTGVVVAVGLMAVLLALVATNPGLPVAALVKRNATVLAFVAVIEYAFFTGVISKYIPAPPSTLVTSALAALEKPVK